MKKVMKAIVAVFMVIIIVCNLVGCSSAKKAWSAKSGDETLPIGTYIYFLAYASSEAGTLVENKEASVLSQRIEDKDAATWIKDRAKHYVEYLFAINKMMEDRGFSLTEEEIENTKAAAAQYWSQMSELLTSYGVAKSSFERVVIEEAMTEKVFEAIYGEDGEIGADEKVLSDYFEKNYTSYEYAIITLSTKDAQGNTVILKDDELAKTIEEVTGWAEDYNSGKIDKAGFIEKYKASPYFSSEEIKVGEEYELIDAVDLTESLKMYSPKIGETRLGNACVDDYSSSGYLQVAFIEDIKDKTEESLADESYRHSLIHACYQDDFDILVEEEIEKLSIEYNKKEIDKINVKKFF